MAFKDNKQEGYEFAEKTENFAVNEFIKNGYNAKRTVFDSGKQNHIEGDWILIPNKDVRIYIEQKTSYGNHCISFNVEDEEKYYSIDHYIGEIESDFIIGLANYKKFGSEEYILYRMDEFKNFILDNLNNKELMECIIKDSKEDPEHNPRYINLLNGTLRKNVKNFYFKGPNAIKQLYNKIMEYYPLLEKQTLF